MGVCHACVTSQEQYPAHSVTHSLDSASVEQGAPALQASTVMNVLNSTGDLTQQGKFFHYYLSAKEASLTASAYHQNS